jgi:plasmid stability protein
MEFRMANLHVRNVDDEIIARLKKRAAENGRSAEAEHRAILESALPGDEDDLTFDQLAAKLRERLKGRRFTSSEVLMRESRDER